MVVDKKWNELFKVKKKFFYFSYIGNCVLLFDIHITDHYKVFCICWKVTIYLQVNVLKGF